MTRRTPLLAILLAPFALWGLLLLWDMVLRPLTVSIWRGETALELRLASDDPKMREQALRDAMSVQNMDAQRALQILATLRNDPAPEVRSSAGQTLGQIGMRQPLPAKVIQALQEVVLAESDDVTLSAAINALGQAAARTACPEAVVARIAEIFDESHLPWLYVRAAEALGRIGAAQPLPAAVFDRVNTVFSTTEVPGLREELSRTFAGIAGGQRLPAATLELLADALVHERNYRIRVQAVYALAHAGADYPRARELIMAVREDADREVRDAAAGGLGIMEADALYADREPMAVALDRSLPTGTRLKAMGLLKTNSRDPLWREQVLTLAGDDDIQVAAEGLGLFVYIGDAPGEEFDRQRLIPRLTAAMSHADPVVRRAAYGTLSNLFVHNLNYRGRSDAFRPPLDDGAEDPDPGVRVVALVALLETDPGASEYAAIVKRALDDRDPSVRRMVAGWLASPKIATDQRQVLFTQLQQDPDAGVRAAAVSAQQQWEGRKRAWPAELWQRWRAGEQAAVGLAVLTAVTIAAPVAVGLGFLLYFMARLLTCLYQRRWRALAVLAVMAIWVAASYGMFLLYFMAGHAGGLDTQETLQLAGLLWGATALYAVAGWGLHYPVRR